MKKPQNIVQNSDCFCYSGRFSCADGSVPQRFESGRGAEDRSCQEPEFCVCFGCATDGLGCGSNPTVVVRYFCYTCC